MTRLRSINSLILIIGAFLIIALALVMIYMLDRLEEVRERDIQPHDLSVVGLDAEPDPEGWKTLFNGHTLEGWEIPNFGPQGPVFVRDSSIILSYGDGITGITWARQFPAVNFEISLEAMRVDGNDFFCGLTFPVDDEHCTFIVGGWAGSLVGLSSIDGRDASDNFTGTSMAFENRKWYNIRVRVDQEFIHCFIDDKEMARVPRASHNFSVRSEVNLSKPLGITSWMTTAALRNIRFREI
jgi:hypothetical protein